jgi:hypothetical protein
MPATSQYLTIINQAVTDLQDLGLTFQYPTGLAAVPIQAMKYAEWLKGVSAHILPMILVAIDDRPDEVTPWSTENEVLAKYSVAFILVGAGNRDKTANMDVWLSFREQERRLFQWGLQPTIQSCLFSEYQGDPPIMRDAALKNYDVSGFAWKFWNVEQRTN